MLFADSSTVVLFVAEISLTATVRTEEDFDECVRCSPQSVRFCHKLSFCSQTCAICSVFQQWWIMFLLTRIISLSNLTVYTILSCTLSALCFHICGFSVTWISHYSMVQSSASVEIVLLGSVVSCEWGCFDDFVPLASASTLHFWWPCYFHTFLQFEMCITTKDQKIWNKVVVVFSWMYIGDTLQMSFV